ncbi:MAG: isoprenylcysteine carboxylmethyltransferase family protein [Acidobacteriota bacterium]
MQLIDQFVRDGDRLFRWRSYLPLVLVPVLLGGMMADTQPCASREGERLWEALAAAVALGGLALRIWAVGTAPAGTSERSTVDPRASELRTTGLYSILRHPLYVANGLIGLGLALFTGLWYLGVITLATTLLYYERIAAREEAFLEERFGEAFVEWAGRVPAMVPLWSGYVPGRAPFSWGRVIQELHGLSVIAAGVFVLDVVQESWRAGRWAFDPLWAWFFGVVAVAFAVFAVTKKTVRRLSPRM